ncbi:MAG TPA: serine/threonine-protein kinase [Gemmataceae bacterium]|nr:serine/threonine-protein kinase [Gemmataceae bacterium]
MAEVVTQAPAEELRQAQSAHDPALTNCLAPPQNADELGRLGKYRVLKIIGHGGMGVVYKAEDAVLKRMVALKAILPALGAGEQMRKRFIREARAMAVLEHENVVRLYDVNEDRGISFIAMELLAGETLEARLKRGAPQLKEAIQISRAVASGLAAAHLQNLIHRDIKPANIFLVADGTRIKILDFGLARADSEDSRLTASGAILGTPAYMSPEQSRGEQVDFRSDLFSLGVVLYRLSTGKEPFAKADALSTMVAIATEEPATPQMQNFELPGELSDLIMQLLDKDPSKRGTAQDVVAALNLIEKGEPLPARPASPTLTPPDDVDTQWQDVATVESKPKKKTQQKARPFPWPIVVVVAVVLSICLCSGIASLAYFLS